jgi:hypothetical protein
VPENPLLVEGNHVLTRSVLSDCEGISPLTGAADVDIKGLAFTMNDPHELCPGQVEGCGLALGIRAEPLQPRQWRIRPHLPGRGLPRRSTSSRSMQSGQVSVNLIRSSPVPVCFTYRRLASGGEPSCGKESPPETSTATWRELAS